MAGPRRQKNGGAAGGANFREEGNLKIDSAEIDSIQSVWRDVLQGEEAVHDRLVMSAKGSG
jgi:hypothetical protein